MIIKRNILILSLAITHKIKMKTFNKNKKIMNQTLKIKDIKNRQI